MKKIEVGSPKGPAQLTVMLVGDSRAGKTFTAGTFPRPLFLSDASEHGWTTLDGIPDDKLYEPGRKPKAVGIEHPKDIVSALNYLQLQSEGQKVQDPAWPLAQGKWEVGTVVIDSLTFYADAYLSHLETQEAFKGDTRRMYGELQSHLRYLMIQFHKLPYHIVWTALASVNEESKLRGALIAGATAAKAPARCDLWLYQDKAEERKGRDVTIYYEAHTENFAGNRAGHRFGEALPPVIEPNYKVIEECLGMEPWTARLGGSVAKGKPPGPPTTATTTTKPTRATAPQ